MNIQAATALVALTLSGCAGTAGATPATSAAFSNGAAFPLSVLAAPDACDTIKNVRTGKGGGSFTLPHCAGWKGTITFPPREGHHQTRSWRIQTSVTNDFGVPTPPSGTAVFYISMFGGDSTFQENSGNDVVTGAFSSDHTYSLMVYNFLYDDQCRTLPCPPWFASIGSPSPGSHSISFPSPLNQASLENAPLVWQFIQN